MKYSAFCTLTDRQQKLLRMLLQKREGLTIEELVNGLEITRTAVKQHLRGLQASGYIIKGPVRMSIGRPSVTYLLSTAGLDLFPKQYSWFSSALLNKMRSIGGTELLLQSFKAIADEVSESLQHRVENKKSAEKIGKIQEVMSELGYEAQLKKQAKGALPVIEAFNCVYHDLAVNNPEVCEFDRALLTNLSGAAVVHEACMVKGDRCCRFSFSELKNKPKH